MGIHDDDVKGKASMTLMNDRRFTKADWVFYAQSLLREKLEIWPVEREQAVLAAGMQKDREILQLKRELHSYKTDLEVSFEKRDRLEEQVKLLQKEVERLQEGLSGFRSRKGTGRPPKYECQVEALRKLRLEGRSVREISCMLGMSPTTIHRFIRKYGIGKGEV